MEVDRVAQANCLHRPGLPQGAALKSKQFMVSLPQASGLLDEIKDRSWECTPQSAFFEFPGAIFEFPAKGILCDFHGPTAITLLDVL